MRIGNRKYRRDVKFGRVRHDPTGLNTWLKWRYYSISHPCFVDEALSDFKNGVSLREAHERRGLEWR